MSIERLAGWTRDAVAWRQRWLAFGAGAASVLAMAPFHFWPLLAVTLPMLVWLIDGAVAATASTTSWRSTPAARAAFAAWWFGFGYFLLGLFWVGEAFFVDWEKFALMAPLAVLILPTGLALFWAVAAAAASLAWHPGLGRVFTIALALGAAEWLRGHVLTGFPWNVLGYALTYPLSLMQSAGVIGIYGLTIVAVFVLAAPLVAWADGGRRAMRVRGGAALIAVVLAMMTYGHVRLAERAPAATDGPRVRIVQPSVPQREKWQPVHQRRIFELHLALTRRNAASIDDGATGIDLVVWPEAAMPFLPLETPEALEMIGKALPKGTHLISGALRTEEPDGKRQIYNSLIAFDADGRAVATYDKIHLVPFGEYLPLNALLDAIGLEPLTRRRGGFSIGPRPRPLMSLPRIPTFAPLICYEAIFPNAIVQGAERPTFLVNVTNDGWFGDTTGPRQHLHQARVRAVEEGLPLLRAANNGISAVIDGRGRLLGRLDLDVVGVIDATLPPALPPTIYGRIGDLPFAMMMLAGFAFLLVGGIRGRRTADVSGSRERG